MEPFSKQEEQKLLEAGKHFYSTAFPNPDRVGCPPQEILKAMALRKYDRNKAKQWDDHMSHCSPCFNDFVAFREGARKSATARWIAVAAAVVLVAAVAVWAWLGGRGARQVKNEKIVAENTGSYKDHLIDFRYQAPVRGPEQNENKSPVEIPRERLTLSVYLPVGSEPGQYEVQVLQEPGQPLAQAEGSAEFRDHIAVLTVRLDLTRLPPGLYLMEIRQSGLSWSQYPVLLK
jgi:hypothetical protein